MSGDKTDKKIEVKISDVFIDPNSGVPIVFLCNHELGIVIPIWIGFLETQSMLVYLNKMKTQRPLTIDLFLKIFTEDLQAIINEVEILKVEGGVFYAAVHFQDKLGKEFIRDCRPSDALSIALALKLPIYIRGRVVENFKPEERKNFKKMLEYLKLEQSS